MKNVRITFRLSPYHLARGLQTIRALEPSYKLISLNDIVKVIYHDYLAKMNINRLDTIPPELLAEVKSFMDNPSKGQMTVEDLIKIKNEQKAEQKVEHTTEDKEAFSEKVLDEIDRLSDTTRASAFNDPNTSDSEISAVTDFSPPKDWKKE